MDGRSLGHGTKACRLKAPGKGQFSTRESRRDTTSMLKAGSWWSGTGRANACSSPHAVGSPMRTTRPSHRSTRRAPGARLSGAAGTIALNGRHGRERASAATTENCRICGNRTEARAVGGRGCSPLADRLSVNGDHAADVVVSYLRRHAIQSLSVLPRRGPRTTPKVPLTTGPNAGQSEEFNPRVDRARRRRSARTLREAESAVRGSSRR